MPFHFDWSESYRIDGGPIDDQHKQLFFLANCVFAVPAADTEEIKLTVKELFRYMEYHFADEERLMQKAAYPELAEHVELHERIIHQMNSVLRGSHSYVQLCATLRHLMVDWVIEHIVNEDLKIHRHLEARRGGKAPLAAAE